jgi:hypothetical protein
MAIEVRQLNVKCGVGENAAEERSFDSAEQTKTLKEEVLSECRRMFLDLLRAERER